MLHFDKSFGFFEFTKIDRKRLTTPNKKLQTKKLHKKVVLETKVCKPKALHTLLEPFKANFIAFDSPDGRAL